MRNLQEWTDSVTGNVSLRTLASAINAASHTTVARRMQNNDPTLAVEIARAYDANPIDALLTIGFITHDDLESYSRHQNLDAYSDIELAQEVVERIRRRENSDLATVTEFPYGAVADSSPEEGGGAPDDYEP